MRERTRMFPWSSATWRIARNVTLLGLLLVGVPVWATIVADPVDSWIGQYWWVAAVWLAAFGLYAYWEGLLPNWVWAALGAALAILKIID